MFSNSFIIFYCNFLLKGGEANGTLLKLLKNEKYIKLKGRVTELSFVQNINKIGFGACYLCELLINVDIPEGITELCKSSFEGCAGLLNVKFPTTLKKVDKWAFKECSSIESLDLSHTDLETIGENAFGNCSMLKSLRLNSTIGNPKDPPFTGCSNLVPSYIYNGGRNWSYNTLTQLFTYLRWKSTVR